MTGDLLKMFSADDLRPAETTETPAVHDIVEFCLVDGSASAVGRVRELLGEGWIKVGIEGIGNFAVAPGRATVRARAH